MEKKSASRELLINILIFGIGTIGSKLIMFFLLPIYTAYMTQSELGVAELVVNYMNFLFPIASVNILTAMLRYSMDSTNDKRKVLQNTILVVCMGCVCVSVFMQIIHTKSSVDNWKIYLMVMLFTYALQQVLSMFAKALDEARICTIGNLIYTGTLFLFSIGFLVFLKRGTAGYLMSMIAANLVSILYFCISLKITQYLYLGKIDAKLLKEMIWFSIPLMVESLSGWLATFCDRFVLEYFMGTDSVGIYSVASKLPSLIAAFASVFMSAWVLSAIKEYEAGSDRTFSNRVFQKFSAIFLVWAVFIIYICKWLMELLVKGNFTESWKYAPLLLCSAVFGGFGNFFAVFYTSAKRNNMLMLSTLLGAAINIVFNIVLIPVIGIQGATLTTMLSQLIVFLYRMIYSQKFVKIQIHYIQLMLALGAIIMESVMVVFGINRIFTAFPVILVVVLYYRELLEVGITFFKKVVERKIDKYEN